MSSLASDWSGPTPRTSTEHHLAAIFTEDSFGKLTTVSAVICPSDGEIAKKSPQANTTCPALRPLMFQICIHIKFSSQNSIINKITVIQPHVVLVVFVVLLIITKIV